MSLAQATASWDPSETDGVSEDWLDCLVVLGESHRVLKSPRGLVFTQYSDIKELMNHPGVKVPVVEQWTMQGVGEGPLLERAKRVILGLDGAPHDRLRAFVKRAFTPRQIQRLRAEARRYLATRLNVYAADQLDFLKDIVAEYPASVIAGVLGIPEKDLSFVSGLADVIVGAQFSFQDLGPEKIGEAALQLDAYLENLVSEKRMHPTGDLMSSLIREEVEGERLSDVEVVSLSASILNAAIDTTRHQSCLALTLFAAYPEQWTALRGDPELVRNAVEEVLRFRPVVPLLSRVTYQQIELDCLSIEPGVFISLALVLANRDPELNPGDPHSFQIDRASPRHLTFGFGPHFCLGASLARMELAELFGIMLERFSNISLVGDAGRRASLGTYGVRSLVIAGPNE